MLSILKSLSKNDKKKIVDNYVELHKEEILCNELSKSLLQLNNPCVTKVYKKELKKYFYKDIRNICTDYLHQEDILVNHLHVLIQFIDNYFLSLNPKEIRRDVFSLRTTLTYSFYTSIAETMNRDFLLDKVNAAIGIQIKNYHKDIGVIINNASREIKIYICHNQISLSDKDIVTLKN